LKTDITAIKEQIKQYAVTCNAGDFDCWISLWTDNGIQMPPDTPARIGKDQIRAAMKPIFDNFILKMAITNKEAKVSGDLGFLRGTYILSMAPKGGGQTIKVDGKYLTILERQADGSWRITHDCFNSNVPPT